MCEPQPYQVVPSVGAEREIKSDGFCEVEVSACV